MILEKIRARMNDIKGEVVKDNETYLLKDNKFLNNLVLSSTTLHKFQSTRGHKHEGQEEIYFFISGFGTIEIDKEQFAVSPGDIFFIPDGAFHRVHNDFDQDLYFVCVFDGKRNH
jgi:mannose-6-phosphate isomerase-like protein (cupin superfamily)